ncbi:paraquat-inducible protein A [Tritonibacter multivorans]|uniref:paraquat-inducible protein A n=1 Tax=Tritonibacter multivorans TaxID=928856 RepID=UPI00071D018F|nr:paraquat-inducible protein A [Tritonibacter multivorans]MDA7422112.1 paraquat-inducible protein A [Tritonibacter multivorans]
MRKKQPFVRTAAFAITSLILAGSLLAFPFLSMARFGFGHETSVPGLVESVAQNWYVLLSLLIALFVLAIPVLRAGLMLYLVALLQAGRGGDRLKRVFRFTEKLTPWAMTEIFVVGTGVGLVKVVDLAQVTFDVSFWLYCGLVIAFALFNASVCRWSIWRHINREGPDARN